MTKDDVRAIVRLMRYWVFDPRRSLWRHRYHRDVCISSELLALILTNTINASRELERELDEQGSSCECE